MRNTRFIKRLGTASLLLAASGSAQDAQAVADAEAVVAILKTLT